MAKTRASKAAACSSSTAIMPMNRSATSLIEIFSTVPDASALAHDTFFQSADSNYNVGPARAIDEIVEKFPSRFRVDQIRPRLAWHDAAGDDVIWLRDHARF